MHRNRRYGRRDSLIAHLTFTLLAAIPALLHVGCVADPAGPVDGGRLEPFDRGVIVVNEGLWRQDNSTLTAYDVASGAAVQDYFAACNPGLRIGDTGNDIVIRNDRAYIAVTTSQAVEVIDLTTGHSLGRVRLPANTDPRRLAIVNDSVGYVTGSRDDGVTEFNPTTLAIRRRFPVGPAPEGIAFAAGRIFVANSGYGTFRQSEPKASTISVLESATGNEIALLRPVSNPLVLHCVAGKLYALSRAILPDTIGALVEFSLATLKEERRWSLVNPSNAAFDDPYAMVYAVTSGGIVAIDLREAAGQPRTLISASAWPSSHFYSIGVGAEDIYVGDAKDYASAGEVLIFSREGALKGRFPCGINPGSYGFY